MHRRESPWRWPAAVALAGGLLAAVVGLVPPAWFAFLFGSRPLEPAAVRQPLPWLELLPPPVVQAAAPTARPPVVPVRREPEPPPADWWTRAWRVRVADDLSRAVQPTPEDSSRVLLEAVGLPVDLGLLVRPDSVLAVRLVLMQRVDALRFDELKPYLHAMARASMYRDLQSRVADMYDDVLHQEIIVPK